MLREPSSRPDQPLRTALDTPLPDSLAIGRGTALFVCGSCFHESRRVIELELRLGSEPSRPMSHGMPRSDLYHRFGTPYAYSSGFWAIVPVPGRQRDETVELGISVALDDGSRIAAPLKTIKLLGSNPTGGQRAQTWAGEGEDRRVAICMATYDPPLDLFERQIESIRAQSHDDWVCILSDDHSDPERFSRMEGLIGADDRFVVSRSSRRQGLYRNFERSLEMAPPDVSFVALCDQDDFWHRDKLTTLLDEIGAATIAYSDARVVDRDGGLRSPTYWSARRNNWTNLTSLVLANSITGAAALYRRDLLELALPFPPVNFLFHDHWLAIIGRAAGDVAYVDRPLYDYVQHGGAALGHENAHVWSIRQRTTSDKARIFRRDPQFFYEHWRATYFSEYCRTVHLARVVLMRDPERLRHRRRRALERLAAGERSPVRLGLRLAARRARTVLGRDETMHAEGRHLRALAWSYLLRLTRPRPAPRARLLPRDSSFPRFDWPRRRDQKA